MSIRIFLFFSLIIFSCNGKEKNDKKAFSINQSTKSISELKNLVINRGDSIAYYELFNEYLDKSSESTELFYYSYVMAFKYNYPKAYIDVFFILCKMYNIDTEVDKINLNSMDIETQQLAIECIKNAAQLNYLNAKKIYQSITTER